MTTLDILVPTYCYPEGVERILSELCPIPAGINIIISDSTPDSSVLSVISKFSDPRLHVLEKRCLSLSPAENWNRLLDVSRSEFVMLMHHDEVPVGEGFLTQLLARLNHTQADLLFLDVVLLNSDLSMIRPHIPRFFRNLIIRRFPSYLFRRNVIGPTASVIVRRSLYPRFRNDLLWLLDVEVYYRLITSINNWATSPGLVIGSVQNSHISLTLSIKDKLPSINMRERRNLVDIYPNARFWLLARGNFVLNTLEWGLWVCLRISQTVYYKTNFYKIFNK